jgi:hypothetical protein
LKENAIAMNIPVVYEDDHPVLHLGFVLEQDSLHLF